MAELRAVARRSTPTHSYDTLQMMQLYRANRKMPHEDVQPSLPHIIAGGKQFGDGNDQSSVRVNSTITDTQ
jgi:hypothetical protein